MGFDFMVMDRIKVTVSGRDRVMVRVKLGRGFGASLRVSVR